MARKPSSIFNRIAVAFTLAACVLGLFVAVLTAEQRLATEASAADIFAAETGFPFSKDASAPASAERVNRQATLHQ